MTVETVGRFGWTAPRESTNTGITCVRRETMMPLATKLMILAFLVVATTVEVSGDAIIRKGLAQAAFSTKTLYFLVGAVLLFAYGFFLNLAPIAFNRVVGIYIATLFVVWQAVSFVTFRSVPSVPVIVGGSLIVLGGIIVAFWGETMPHA